MILILKRNVDDGNEPFPPSLYVKEEDSKEPLLKKHGWYVWFFIFIFNFVILNINCKLYTF